jgi:hypothetical protein
MPRHELTQEDRARGRQTRAANGRERRERAEQDLFEALDKATGRLVDLLDSEDPAIALRAVVTLLDRVLGRPRQKLEHTASLAVSGEAARVRGKLDQLIERRAQELAAEK